MKRHRGLKKYFHFWEFRARLQRMIVTGTSIVEKYFSDHAGHKGISVARRQYEAWLGIARAADWNRPADIKASHPKASILKGGRVVFNIKANDFRLIAIVRCEAGVLLIRFFGSHQEYDKVDAETV